MSTLKGYFFPRLSADDEPVTRSTSSTRWRPAGSQKQPDIEDGATFNVFVLGARGAGKTVFLASLFHSLSVQDKDENNFVLSCTDIKSMNQLRNTFWQVSKPDGDWPAGTFSRNEYLFDCEHVKADKKISLFKFRYFDFPGGLISETNSDTAYAFIESNVLNADSVLVLLDGKKIRNLLDDVTPPEGESTIYEDLDMMAYFLQKCSGKPMHFVVTKSDILNPRTYSLGRIRKSLMRHKHFRNIAEQQKAPAYLIPVSAVGNDFAVFDPATQQMRKKPQGLVKPTRVDIPLTLTLVDFLKKEASKTLPEDENKAFYDWLWKRMLLAGPVVVSLTGPAVNAVVHAATKERLEWYTQFAISAVAAILLVTIMKAGGAKFHDIIEGIKKDIDARRQKTSDRKSALDTILDGQMSRAQRFHRHNPDSLLSGGEGQVR